MSKKINKKRIAKMQQGRMEKLKRTKGLIWDVGDGIQIKKDAFQFILERPGYETQYYHFDCLDEMLKDLFYVTAAEKMAENDKKNLSGIIESFGETKKWFKDVLSPVLSPFSIPDSTRKLLAENSKTIRDMYFD